MANFNSTVNSTVKHITSGNAPTTTTLANGELAFGIVGGKQHLYGNDNGSIVDILLEGNPINVLEGFGGSSTDTLSQNFITELYDSLAATTDTLSTGLSSLQNNVLQKDNLVVYTPTTNYHPATYKFVKDEISALGNMFVLKGRKDTKAEVDALPSASNEIGDVWLVGLTTDTDLYEYVWTSESKWEPLGKTTVTDLSNYYTKAEIDALFTNYYTKTQVDALIPTTTSQLTNNSNFVVDSTYVHTDNNYTNTDKAKVNAVTTSGDGTKVLTDDGTYGTISVTVTIPSI